MLFYCALSAGEWTDFVRLHREALLEDGFSENITLLQRRPVEDLAKTLALAYSLREERVANSLNEENESSELSKSTASGQFKFGKEDDHTEPSARRLLPFRRSGTSTSATSQSNPTSNGTTSRWAGVFFKSSSNSQLTVAAQTPPSEPHSVSPPPPPPPPQHSPALKFSPGTWGASLSAASRKFTKLRIASPDSSPSSSKTAVHLDDRPSALSNFNRSTSAFSARVGAAVRDSFERRNEIMSKVGEWVANAHDVESNQNDSTEQEDVAHSPGGYESRATEEIKRLEGEIRPREKAEVSPEEYIAQIKKRWEGRDEKEIVHDINNNSIDDPLGVGDVS